MSDLLNDLAFVKSYKMICELAVKYWEDGEFTFADSKEDAQEKVDDCQKIIDKITEKLSGKGG